MSNLRLILAKEIVKNLHATEQIGHLVVLRPTNHVIRGFLIERTTTKDQFYLWAMVVPLFTPEMTNVSLNYSHRISHVSWTTDRLTVPINCNNLAKQVAQILEENYMKHLAEIESPNDFLFEFESKGDFQRPNIALDFALAQCLSGNVKVGLQKLEDIFVSESDAVILPKVKQIAKRVMNALHVGEHAFNELITEFEDDNVKRHFNGLSRTLA